MSGPVGLSGVPSSGCGCWGLSLSSGTSPGGEAFPSGLCCIGGKVLEALGGWWKSLPWLWSCSVPVSSLAVFTPLVLRPTFSTLAEAPDHVPNVQLSCGLLPFPTLLEREGFNPRPSLCNRWSFLLVLSFHILLPSKEHLPSASPFQSWADPCAGRKMLVFGTQSQDALGWKGP